MQFWDHVDKTAETQEKEVLDKMKDSKIVLNVMPWFKNGIHDRVINAMLAGAVCLTDKSKWMAERFEDGKDYWSYSLDKLEELPQIVNQILTGDNEEMRVRAYEKANEGHRWMKRIEELEQLL